MNATKAAFGGSRHLGLRAQLGQPLAEASACWALSQTWRPSRSFADSSGVSAIQPAEDAHHPLDGVAVVAQSRADSSADEKPWRGAAAGITVGRVDAPGDGHQ